MRRTPTALLIFLFAVALLGTSCSNTESPVEPSDPNRPATLIVRTTLDSSKCPNPPGSMTFQVYVDDQTVGAIQVPGEERFSVPPGSHRVGIGKTPSPAGREIYFAPGGSATVEERFTAFCQ